MRCANQHNFARDAFNSQRGRPNDSRRQLSGPLRMIDSRCSRTTRQVRPVVWRFSRRTIACMVRWMATVAKFLTTAAFVDRRATIQTMGAVAEIAFTHRAACRRPTSANARRLQQRHPSDEHQKARVTQQILLQMAVRTAYEAYLTIESQSTEGEFDRILGPFKNCANP
jgi:hypothetical protein